MDMRMSAPPTSGRIQVARRVSMPACKARPRGTSAILVTCDMLFPSRARGRERKELSGRTAATVRRDFHRLW